MIPTITYHESAFKHGVKKADIAWALKTQVYEEAAKDDESVFLAVGFDRAGNPLEVGFREPDENALYVFHAMPCRKIFRDKAGV